MTAAFGKSCGACTMCCSALEIDYFKKPRDPSASIASPAAAARSMPSARKFARLRMRMADAARSVAPAAPGPGRHTS